LAISSSAASAPNSTSAGAALPRALGCRRYLFPVGAKDTAPPLLEVTSLNVPERRNY